MAITTAVLTTGGTTTDASSYTTASISPGASKLLLVPVYTTCSAGTPAVTVSGLGLTWELVISTQIITAGRTMWLFRAATGASAPTAGALTIATGGVTLTNMFWTVAAHTGTDLSGNNNGASAIVQTDQARPSAASISDPLPSAVTAGNVCFAAAGVAVAEIPAPGTGWASLDGRTQTNLVNGYTAMIAAPAVQNVLASWTTSAQAAFVAAEIKAAPAAGLNRLRIGDSTVNAIRVGDSTVSKVYVGDTQVWP